MNVWFRRLCGVLVVIAGLSFGLADWLTLGLSLAAPTDLLPLVGARSHLCWVVACYLLCCLSLMTAVVGLQSDPRAGRSKTMRVGALLTLLGCMGLGIRASDYYTLYALTSSPLLLKNLIHLQPVLQFHGPLLLCLFVSLMLGSTIYSAGFYHIDATGVWSKRLFLLGLSWGLAGHYLAKPGLQSLVQFGFLSWISLAYVWLGFEICFRFRPPRPKALAPPGREHLF